MPIQKTVTLEVQSLQAAQAVDPAQSQLLGRVEAKEVVLVQLASVKGDAQVSFHVDPEHAPRFGQSFSVTIVEDLAG